MRFLFFITLLAGVWSGARAGTIVINEIMYHPSSEIVAEEFIELHNISPNPVNLNGWRFTQGIQFQFPDLVIPSRGYLVVAANLQTFAQKYPGVSNVVGNWEGRLSNRGEELELQNASGQVENLVRYADEGEWGRRIRGPLQNGHRGWIWTAEHDGGGKSLELINASLPNHFGQNWAASGVTNGTPGSANSSAALDGKPLIAAADHAPFVPSSTDPVLISAVVLDEWLPGLQVALYYRLDGMTNFNTAVMGDTGLEGDSFAGDGRYSALLPAQKNGSVIEFFIQAQDISGQIQTLPFPVSVDGIISQIANFLCLVDDTVYTDPDPLYRLIMTEAERAELAALGRNGFEAASNAEMNGTFISSDASGVNLRYNVGIRNRGNGSRTYQPNNHRIQFRNDQQWKERAAINLNTRFPYLQLVGSALFQRAGLPAFESWPVQVRINSSNAAFNSAPMFGFYICNEVLDSEFAEAHFPADSSGNIYRGIRLDFQGGANLRFQGFSPDPYRINYFKETNQSEDDWSDLTSLTFALSTNTPDNAYISTVEQSANIRQWFRYLAINTIFDNNETSISNGDGDDYYLYRGELDRRFILLPHDLDTILGQGDLPGLTNASLFRATLGRTGPTVLDRLLKFPALAPEYYRELKDLCETTFSANQVNPFLDNLLGSRIPATAIAALKNFVAGRTAFILSQIPNSLSVTSSLPLRDGVYLSTNGLASLEGRAPILGTATVEVNGQSAAYTAWEGNWNLSELPLFPGYNRVLIRSFDSNHLESARLQADVFFETTLITALNGPITNSVTLRAAEGPFRITNDFIVAGGGTLEIEAGTTVYFEPGTHLAVYGGLLANGSPEHRIRFTRAPGSTNNWAGIIFSNTTSPSRLTAIDIDYAAVGVASIHLQNSDLTIENATWSGTTKTIIETLNSSLVVRDSTFPGISQRETVHGFGIPANGRMIFERNVFGSTTGYNDVMDFTGGQRPGPILQVIDNLFLGGGDDGVDIDGTDAHLEGNTFMNFHKDPSQPGTSSAIAAGSYGTNTSEMTVARNVFFNNDHGILLKEGAFLTAQNNTFAGCTIGVINFSEPDRGVLPGAGAYLENNILWNNAQPFENLFPTNGTVALTVNFSLIEGASPWPGISNLNADPLFQSASDVHLRSDSPALGSGSHGADMGAYVPPGLRLSEIFGGTTWQTNVIFIASGPGFTGYKYRLNAGDYGVETSIAEPLNLPGLTNGNYTIEVLGKNSAGVWQAIPATRSWTVNTSFQRLRLNEVLAKNVSAVAHGVTFPDLIELHYEGALPLDLGGISLSDNLTLPRKFTFPFGTMIQPSEFLVLDADDEDSLPGWHLGFSLKDEGEAVFLHDWEGRGGALLDSVTFGSQLADFSVGRLADGTWGLNLPTFGASNLPQRTARPNEVQINEWLAESGDRFSDDFVELVNPSALPVSIGGLFLTDQFTSQPRRHQISPLSFIPANGFTYFLADGNVESGSNHLNFKLSADAGSIALVDASGALLDYVAYGPQRAEISQGRVPSGNFYFFTALTPGGPNTSPIADSDADGIPDDWEFTRGLNLYRGADGGVDSDADGHSNLQEFRAGTDPLLGSSVLKLFSVGAAPQEAAFLFEAIEGKTYFIQEKTTLHDPEWITVTNFAPEISRRWIQWAAPAGNRAGFFRLITVPGP